MRKTFKQIQQELVVADSSAWARDAWRASSHRSDVMFRMEHGKQRRAEIVRLLQAGVDVRVDCKYSIQVKSDRDVQKLIDMNICDIYKVRTWWNSSKKWLRLKHAT